MKGGVFVLVCLGLLAAVKGSCDEENCVGCLSSGCWFCGGSFGEKCAAEQTGCPNGTTYIFPPHFQKECPSTTTSTTTSTPNPPTSPPPTRAIPVFVYVVFYIFWALVGGMLVLLVVFILYYYVYPKVTCYRREYQRIPPGERVLNESQVDVENNPFADLHLAEQNSRIRTSRGGRLPFQSNIPPLSFDNPLYDEDVTLYQRRVAVVDLQASVTSPEGGLEETGGGGGGSGGGANNVEE